jgi:nucleotide-binding universal stress UspA family protein
LSVTNEIAIRKIIVPTDFSDLSEIAARSAASLATPEAASIHLLHVIRLPFLHTTYDLNVPEAVWEGLRKGTHERLAETRLILEGLGVTDVHQIVSESLQPAEAIAQSVKKLDADLVVMATHGRQGLKHALLGSVTERTLRTSPVPVLAVKGQDFGRSPIQRILLATDFSSHANQALSLACSFAKSFGAHIDVLHVLDESPDYIKAISAEIASFEKQARAMAGEHLEAMGGQVKAANLSMTTHLGEGRAVEMIASEAARLESDLIVMGTHGHTGFAHVTLGSVAERTLRLAPCSVLTTRSNEE